MKKIFIKNKKIYKRIVSFTVALTLVYTGMPANIISEDIQDFLKDSGFVVSAKAEGELDALKAKYTGHTYTFTSEQAELSEYSQCFQDATWAADHANDTITLNPMDSRYLFDSNYSPIGNSSAPFYGTIYMNTSADDFYVEANSPIFDYVKDSVKLYKMSTTTVIPLNINRLADVGDTVSPLLANHIVGSGATDPFEWKVILNDRNSMTYSGVIYEMTNGAKVNLTFTDKSTHTPRLDPNGNIYSGSIIDNTESGKNYGILCGAVKGSDTTLKAKYICTDSSNAVTFIGTDSACCGGLIGEINGSTFELLSGSSAVKVDFQTAKNQVGFICGHAEEGSITLPTGYEFSGTINGKKYAGGIAGYCKNTSVTYETATGTITLSGCTINNGSDATATGGVFGYYECDKAPQDILLDRTYNLTSCTVVSGNGYSGGIAGDYKSTYTSAATINLDKYTLGSIALSGTAAGGLFGRYTPGGSVTITDSNTSNTHFIPPASSAAYGGVIGEYVNSAYTNTLTLSGFTVNGLRCTSSGNVGGVIGTLNGSTYVSVSNVSVTSATADSSTSFGGIISTLDGNNAGSFIDLIGDFTLTMVSGKSYKGGAIAASFKEGIIRLAGITDISGAQAANGYAQLVYENDETLVYAKGSGSDYTAAVAASTDPDTGDEIPAKPASGWTLKRNADTTASDLGQWGEVVRLFKVGTAYKNLEEAGIVTVANNKVTLAQGVTVITDTVTFAKCALNMQLNDGADHGPLCFADKTTYPKSVLLGSALTVSGTVDLTGTGLLGLMRDGGNGKYYDVNNDNSKTAYKGGDPDFFEGSLTGSSSAKILLSVGEKYGTYPSGTADNLKTGGAIYLSGNYGHDSIGLFSHTKAATVKTLEISGMVDVRRVNGGGSALYLGSVSGFMTNGLTCEGVTVSTEMDIYRSHENGRFYIGGVAGLFDGTSGSGTLDIKVSSSVSPTITLHGANAAYGTDNYDSRNAYIGGILGLLGGKSVTVYGVSVNTSAVVPIIILDSDVADTDYSYLGGMIGRVRSNSTNERTITLNTVTMTGARVDTKAKYPGGLLGAMWDRTNLTVDGLTITGSTVNHKYSGTGSKQSGLVFSGSGKWDINSLSMAAIPATADKAAVNTAFTSVDTAPESFGLIVNEAFSGDDGLYINLQNRGYSLTGVTVPTSYTYFDEIAAATSSGDILVGGNGTGIVNINMNAAGGTLTKIVDSVAPANGTGTYQNQLYSQIGNLVANQNSRYYYNLDAMMSTGHTKTGGEKFLLWSVSQYAATNISTNFSDAITGYTDIELSGLSYYPIPGGEVTLPTGSTVTFGFKAINDYEDATRTPDSWSRNPDDIGEPKNINARNQHYLMQTGLFTTVTSLSADTLTLTGDFGYVSGVASGALINNSTSGAVTLSGLTLDKLIPSNAASYLLIKEIDGTGDALPSLTVSNLRATNYNATGVTLPVAKSLFGNAKGQNMTMNFSDIKLDARNGTTPTGSGWDSAAATNMNSKYGTSRSIFSTATFFTELLSAKTSTIEYNYTVEQDWGTGTPRNVTYGKEVTSSKEYENGEKRYSISSGTGRFTNPVSDSNTEFDFSVGFLPYVANYENKGVDATYPVVEIKVNYKVAGLIDGCGTYNDPYIISTPDQLKLVADVVNNGTAPSPLRLPNEYNADHVITSWHGAKGDGLYNLPSGQSTYSKDTTNTQGISSWTKDRVRYYLASAYYVINTDLTGTNSLPADFEGIGKPSSTTNGNTVFHGVIIGKKSNGSAPTITNPSPNPLIYISNGSVVKNLIINVTANISRSLDRQGDDALYGYKPNNATDKGAEYYGGVIGEIMGGDNIIDDVTVRYTGTTALSGGSSKDYKHLIAEGGMVGCVVNGALIFRGSNSVTGRTVTGGGIYSNQFVGRVINGYAVYESITGRTGTAPDNYNKRTVDGENETKTYTYRIDTIDRSKTTNSDNLLNVNYTSSGTGTITVPDAQSLYIMSLITQSIASTAETSSLYNYYKYSPSYGYNTDNGFKYINGVARLGDYSSVGCGTSAVQPDDYASYAILDSVNNYTNSSAKDGLMKAPVPYIIYRYTTRYGSTAANPAADFPARRMTFDNSKFWDITLSSSNTFNTFGDNFKAFRGIGSVGINACSQRNNASKTAFKIATFDGGNNTIKLHISLPRYRRDQENYFHYQNKSLTQTYSGDNINTQNYGHDQQLWQVMGIGFFDCVLVKNDSDHDYQFQNLKLQGIIEDVVYDSAGNVVTGTCTYNNNQEETGQTQLFCVGGVVGKRVTYGGSGDTNNAYDTDCNYSNIRFDGLTITGAYSCGGLVGIDAIKAKRKMEINNCNSTSNGISITGGYYGKDNNLRHGIGSFVGMTFWCRPYIDGGTNKSKIYVSNVTTFYNGTGNRCAVGGLIGYTGSGAEIKNIDLYGLGTNPVVGSSQSSNAAGFIGFSQATNETGPNTTIGDDNYYLNEAVYIENCTLNNTSVRALNSAAGFLARGGNANNKYYPKYIKIINCAVIGSSTNKPEIRTYGTTNSNTAEESRFSAGGFIADFSIHTNTNVVNTPALTSVIENSYIKDYKIEGNNVGGIIGAVNQKPAYLRNLYVQNCDIITTLATANYYGNVGGIVGYSSQNLSGYNLKIDGVNFYRRSGDTLTDVTTTDAGIIVGRNSSSLVDKFVGICAYHTTVAKVPTAVVKTNGNNASSFYVFADYMNTSASDTASTSHASTFNGGSATVDQPVAPFLTVNPRKSMGTGEYLTGDGAGIGTTLGNAGEIYKDYKAGTSNRRYSIGTTADPSFSSTETNDSAVLEKYINDNGTYNTSGVFKISTASAEFKDEFTSLTGVNDFAMLVINDDPDKAADITPFIKSYIRLVTNAEMSSNNLKYNQYAYSYGNNNIDELYKVVVSPCYYDSSAEKFVLGEAGEQGLQLADGDDAGKYKFVSDKADSESDNICQFSLIDVQFKDPTSNPTATTGKIAYHLYVPVYTKKMLTAKFTAVPMSATTYERRPYTNKIASEIAAGNNRSILVESTNEWTTTFVRYTYPKDQISREDTWNFDKDLVLNLDGNFSTLPNGTKLILVDPNANSDKYYMLTLDGTYSTNTDITLHLSDFKDASNTPFAPQNLSAILDDSGAWGTGTGHTNELYEDYYISIYVPNIVDGQTHGLKIDSVSQMTHGSGTDIKKANIESKLHSYLILGDLFNHSITENSFQVTSGNGNDSWNDDRKMTATNNVLKMEVTATVQIKNAAAGSYLRNTNVYHAFYLTLTSHDANGKVSDIIYGINPGNVSNTTTLTYTDSGGTNHTDSLDNSVLEANYVYLSSDSIRDVLMDTSTPVITIHSESIMTFNDTTAFPYNPSENATIGTQVSVKSSLAYREDELRFSSLNKVADDTESKRYYSTDQHSAQLTFNAVPDDDTTDEIGFKTNNRSLLGVNGKYGPQHPIKGKAIYNVDDIIDYNSAKNVVYTISLQKKVTDGSGTRYVQVDRISDYMTGITLTDSNGEVDLEADMTDPDTYVYTGAITHGSQLDLDKLFEVDFECKVLTGDTVHNKYANYKIVLTADLDGANNASKDSYLIYTNAKFDPSVIDE